MKRDNRSLPATRHVAQRTNRGRKAFVMKSVKNGLEIRLESRDELALAKVLDLDPRGVQLRAQAATFDLHTGDIHQTLPDKKLVDSRYYTPDFLDVIGGIEYVFEVKPLRFCSTNETLFESVRNFCSRKGLRFVVISKESMGANLLSNVALLHQFARQCSDLLPLWADAVDRLVMKSGHVKDVLGGLEPTNHYLLAAILKGVLKTDLHSSCLGSMDFLVEPAYGDLTALEFIPYD